LATVPVVPATAAPAAKKAKKPRPVAAAVRVEVAAAAPAPPPVAIGDLTAEEDASAGRKAVVNLINENERRLASLSAEVKERQKDQVLRVRNFQVDARKVLAGGDEDAAITLATKAKVLLDELTK
jgi:hypothetical protein